MLSCARGAASALPGVVPRERSRCGTLSTPTPSRMPTTASLFGHLRPRRGRLRDAGAAPVVGFRVLADETA
ncbi:hypothetical protein GCM10010330_76540 [Streptomyces tendae]|nr:hypothetical protein GCM10010330_76540 [Streptomyces tendae]